jgi:hypothetical protein
VANPTDLIPIDPWRSLAVHFGMLLGPDDFVTLGAYHRGKMWLHAAWLHREGVIWGLAPSIDADRSELRIEPGLALDARGRELHLERPACIDLGKWFAARAAELLGDAAPSDETIALEQLEDGSVRLNAHVRIRFVGCLDRPVPALVEPCDGAGQTTAYSRVFETVELELIPGLPEPTPPAYPRLRMLFGLDPISEDSPSVDDSAEIEAARTQILATPIADRPAELERAFHRFAARDAAQLGPAVDADGVRQILPALEPAALVIAELHGLTLRPDGQTWVYEPATPAELNWEQRPTHVATRPIQDLIAAAGVAALVSGGGVDSRGPTILRDALEFGEARFALEFSAPVDIDSLVPERLSLSAFVPGTGWRAIEITELDPDATGMRFVAAHGSLPNDATRLRLRVDGTSSTPVIGADGWPLAGADDDPPTSTHAGRDFVHMQIRGE